MMLPRRTLLTGLLASPGFSQQKPPALYEEDLLATMPVREKNWKELEAYSSSLAAGTRYDYSSPQAYLRSVEPLREKLRGLTGYPPPGFFAKPGKPRWEKAGEDSVATYQRVWIPVAPSMQVYGLYITPKALRKPAPLLISKHGGGGFPEMATYRGGANYKDQVRGAVERGYVVFAPLSVMYPYRDRDNGSPIPADIRKSLDEKLRAAGTSLAAVEVHKISKALDVLLTERRNEIDPKRVAMIGLSYGGFYTLYTAALEPRIAVAVASCSFRDFPAEPPKSAEGRLIDLASPELVALIAPRPLQVQAGVSDKGFPIDDVRRGIAKARPYYDRLGLGDRFEFAEFDGGHEFRGDICWKFLARHLHQA